MTDRAALRACSGPGSGTRRSRSTTRRCCAPPSSSTGNLRCSTRSGTRTTRACSCSSAPTPSSRTATAPRSPIRSTRSASSGARGGRAVGARPAAHRDRRARRRHLAIRPGTDHFVLAWLVRELLATAPTATSWPALRPGQTSCGCRRSSRDTRPRHRGDRRRRGRAGRLLDDVRRAGRLSAMCGTGVTMSRDGLVAEWLRWVLLIVTGSVDRPGGMRCNRAGCSRSTAALGAARARPAGPGAGAASAARPPPVARPVPVRGAGRRDRGRPLRVLLVPGGNPLTAFPDPARTRAALGRLDALSFSTSSPPSSARSRPTCSRSRASSNAPTSRCSRTCRSRTARSTRHGGRAGSRAPAGLVGRRRARAAARPRRARGGSAGHVHDDDLLRSIAAGSRGGYDESPPRDRTACRAPDRTAGCTRTSCPTAAGGSRRRSSSAVGAHDGADTRPGAHSPPPGALDELLAVRRARRRGA